MSQPAQPETTTKTIPEIQPEKPEKPEKQKEDKEKEKGKVDWKKRAQEAEAKLTAQNNAQGSISLPDVHSEQSTPNLQPPLSPHSHKENEPHFIGAWQRYCPTCGDQNPNFKDETECVTCHTRLGAREVAQKLKACPNCGGKNAKVIQK